MILKEGKEGKGKKNYTERARTMKERKKERKKAPIYYYS